MDELNPPILSIPGMGIHSAAMILAEIGDFSNFSSPDKILAYAGCSPSTYQSGKLTNCYAYMEKRGSRYLRYALYNATKSICHCNGWAVIPTRYDIIHSGLCHTTQGTQLIDCDVSLLTELYYSRCNSLSDSHDRYLK